MTNRLNLNFKLETKEERVEFARTYLESLPFVPTPDELDTIAKYILWGKSPNGLNGRQEGLELETRHKTWDTQRVESLDALIESPNFSESMLRPPTDPPTRISKEVFSRSRARKEAPAFILEKFEPLWSSIDEIELLIALYDLKHDRRKLQPRPALLQRFSAPQIDALNTKASTLSTYNYLKLKHELVELRREQYTLKDEYAPQLLISQTPNFCALSYDTFDTDFPVLPTGIPYDTQLYYKIFNLERYPAPSDFDDAELAQLSKILWTPAQSTQRYFDFGDTAHLYKLFDMWELLQSESISSPIESTLKFFLRAASMYKTLAAFDPIIDAIFEMKLQKKSNQDIADAVNAQFGKTYKPNYISTLYCKKGLGSIAAAAKRHREVLENLFFPENFKTCKDCGKTLLLDEENFMRRHRSKDGFSPRCKRCEKLKRDLKKES